MSGRLRRIEALIVSLTAAAGMAAYGFAGVRPFGIVLGGVTGLLDFVLIRKLAGLALEKKPPLPRLVGMAFAKSLVLIVVPAAALVLPGSLVDGVSFAIGVSVLPLAIVLDAALPLPASAI